MNTPALPRKPNLPERKLSHLPRAERRAGKPSATSRSGERDQKRRTPAS